MREFKDNNIRITEECGIFFMSYKIKKIDIKAAKEIVAKRIKFIKDDDALLFIDASNLISIDCESRNYFASKEATVNLNAIAIYANTNYARFLFIFMLKINTSLVELPKKVFSNKKMAIN